VIFPKGIDNGAVLKFKDKGHLNGDLIVRVSVRKHSTFRREGNDSLIEKEINVVEAVLGATINV
jgi:DnaJ-class molecular chaperone